MFQEEETACTGGSDGGCCKWFCVEGVQRAEKVTLKNLDFSPEGSGKEFL